MAYTINLTDGTIFAVVADGTINTDSSQTLVGKNRVLSSDVEMNASGVQDLTESGQSHRLVFVGVDRRPSVHGDLCRPHRSVR